MNVLSLVFSILLIFSFGFYAYLQKESSIYRIQKTFLSQVKTHRLVLGEYEKQTYKSIRAIKKTKTSKSPSPIPRPRSPRKVPTAPSVNPQCARLNLWPLLQADAKEEPFLYEQFAQMIRTYYQKPLFQSFSHLTRLEYHFLDAWLAQMRQELTKNAHEPLVLEKITFTDHSLQMLYYNMLRGSKNKYPPLLDSIKAIPMIKKKEKLCLLHATPTLLSAFFGDAAQDIYNEMHKETLAVTEERIEELCRKHHHLSPSKELFEWVSLSRFKHQETKEVTVLEEDKETQISVRKKIYKQ